MKFNWKFHEKFNSQFLFSQTANHITQQTLPITTKLSKVRIFSTTEIFKKQKKLHAQSLIQTKSGINFRPLESEPYAALVLWLVKLPPQFQVNKYIICRKTEISQLPNPEITILH